MTDKKDSFPLPAPRNAHVDVLVIAGEHSGDEHAARMVGALLHRNPDVEVAAVGGTRLAGAGAQLLFDLTESSVVGFAEVVRHFGFFRRLFAAVTAWIRRYRPRVVCFVDYPGFNLRLAKKLAAAGISHRSGGHVRIVYYISPQIWAWKAHRRFAMARTLDALAVIFPFETDCYADTDLDTRFVGHPFVEPEYRSPLEFASEGPVLLLPGSRKAAVEKIFPVLRDAFAEHRRRHPAAAAVVVYPEESIKEVVMRSLQDREELATAVSMRRRGDHVAASAVLTSSGTMSLLCALSGIPGAIAYRTNPLTYLLAKRWVKVPYIGIANILLKQPLYPEFVQKQATAAVLAGELDDCCSNPERVAQARRLAKELREHLRQPPRGDAASWLSDQLVD